MADIERALEHGVLTLTFNRPDRLNALSTELLQGLMAALESAGADPEVGAIILTGAGRAFCAGGDVKTMEGRGEQPVEARLESLRSRARVVLMIKQCPKPVIAMVNGPAFGAGFSIALACDLRIAGRSARFGTAFGRIGLSGDFGGSYNLTRLVGPMVARELYLLAEPFDAERAQALGLLTRLVPDESLREEAMAFARRLADGPRIAHGYMKRNLLAAETESLATVLELEAVHQMRTNGTEDHKEAVRAFAEKRPPVFRGR
ncbi:MAG TPA: enoyl-CoA hydratase [Acetobacteraceae bacterium]|nr:enoyl-CoA hydratase [Acetobacteraceae bacterium]